MPSLKLFGQRTPVAGDDLRVYSFFFLSMRLAQLGASIALLIYTSNILNHQDTFFRLVNNTMNPQTHESLLQELEGDVLDCMDAHGEGDVTYERVVRINHSYLVLSIFLAVAGIVYANLVCQVSSRGTPTNGQITIALPGPRPDRQRTSVLQSLCHIHLTIFTAVRLAGAILGITVYYEINALCDCAIEVNPNVTLQKWNLLNPDAPPAVMDANPADYGCTGTYYELYYFLMVTHILEVFLNTVVITYVASSAFCSTKAWAVISKKLLIPRTLGSEGRWRLFCRCCCTLTSVASCFLLGGREAALGDFTEIAMLLSDFFDFHGTLDVTATDMVTALLLLGQVQAQRIHDARRQILEKTHEYKSTRFLGSNYLMQIPDSDDDEELDNKSTDTMDSDIHNNNNNNNNNEISGRTSTSPSMRRVLKKIKMSQSFAGVHYRLKRYSGAEYNWEAQITKLLDVDNANDVLTIAEGARFIRLSLAIYTWVMYSFNRPCTGCCTICCVSMRRDCCGERPKETYFGDGRCCRLHSAAFLREAGIDDESEVVYAYFHSGVVEAPHAVVLDHVWRSVVIVIRGTLSLEDILTDLTIKPTSLEDAGKAYGFDGSSIHVHGGMLATCEWILKGFQERRILEKLFAAESPYANYQLRVTGHSLGAGVAAILAMMLRPRYPKVKCHAFSPPGCTMSENAARDCEQFITAYILDADIIPRASLTSLENLRLDLVNIISRIKVPKNEVLDEFTGCWGRNDRSTIADRMLYEEDETPRSKFTNTWKKYRQLYDAKKMNRGSPTHTVELFPPGKLVQLFPSNGIDDEEDMAAAMNNTGKSCPLSCFGNDKRPFSARWANRQDFREIRISSHFVDDHIPLNVLNRLEDEAERFGLAPPYLVEVHSESATNFVEPEPAVVKVESILVGVADECGEGDEGIEISCY